MVPDSYWGRGQGPFSGWHRPGRYGSRTHAGRGGGGAAADGLASRSGRETTHRSITMAWALRERRTSVDPVARMNPEQRPSSSSFNWAGNVLEISLTAPCHPLVSVGMRWHALALALAEMGPQSCHTVDPPWSPWIRKTTPCSKPWSVTVAVANSISSWRKEMAAPGVAIRSACGAMSFRATPMDATSPTRAPRCPTGSFSKRAVHAARCAARPVPRSTGAMLAIWCGRVLRVERASPKQLPEIRPSSSP